MDAFSFEMCVDEGDRLDRTLSFRVMSGKDCLAQRSMRLRREVRIGQALLEIERLLLQWLSPVMEPDRHLEELFDRTETALCEPF